MTAKIEFNDLKAQYAELKESINARIQGVLNHGKYIMGPEVHELEEKLETFTSAKHCITVASGTEALLIALMALGVKQGDEIITTPFTFVATAEVISLLGAVPVFVDIEADTCNINASLINAAVTSRTKAIIPVSLYGQPADIDEINVIAEQHGNIPVIEDAAQSFGASYKGKKSCNLTTIGCTSFFPSKPLGCYGDGGAIFTNDDTLARAMREIRVHGQERRYHHTRIGVGGRMDTLQCAIVLAKLERFEWEIEQRIRVGKRYNELFAGIVQTVTQRPDRKGVYGQFTMMVERRGVLQQKLTEAGIPVAVHYPIPLHLQPAYANVGKHFGDFPVAEAMSGQVMSIPMSPTLSEDEINQIVRAVLENI